MTARRADGGAGRCRPAQGFTLLEVLVALTVMGLMFAVLTGGLRMGGRYQERARQTIERTAEFQTTHRLFRRLLTRAYPLAYEAGDELRFVFGGSRASVRFVALMAAYPGQPGPQLFVFELSENNGLVLSRRPYLAGGDPFDDSHFDEEIVLVEGPISGHFSYFEPDIENTGGFWRDDWTDSGSFPGLVRLSITRTGEADDPWPDLVVAVAIGMDLACVFDDQDIDDGTRLGKCRLDVEAGS